MLDGSRDGEPNTDAITGILTAVFKQNGAEVRVFSPRHLKLTNCIGCFGCWLETPGICRYKEPDYKEIFKTWVQSDAVVMLTPVTFGGYSSSLKKVIDRILPVLLPYFHNHHGEIHHLPRYAKSPRLIGIGVQNAPNNTEAETFKLLVGRHAIDMVAPNYAAEVINVNDGDDHLRKVFQSLLTREDVFPRGNVIKRLVAPGEAAAGSPEPNNVQHACLIIGSPKTLSNSSSSILGNYILDILKQRGWETESLTLKPSLLTREGESALYAAVDHADLLIFAFPLYIDALPFLMTRALELMASHRQKGRQLGAVRLFTLVNNGFPESYQNNVALSICRNFAAAAGMTWAGGLALGAGEAIVGGEPIKEQSRLGFPLYKVHRALKTAADALAEGRPVPEDAWQNLAKCPIPFMPFFVWRFLFINSGKGFWERRAAEFKVDKKDMLARPYVKNSTAKCTNPINATI